MNFLKENWFKLAVAIMVVVVGGFILYSVNLDTETESSSTGIESSPFYDECLAEAIEVGSQSLISQGYQEQEDGSWVDTQGNYPTGEIEEEEERLMTEVFFDCLKVKEQSTQKDKEENQYSEQKVYVKYRDSSVDIAHLRFEYLDTSKSSWVKGAWYDDDNGYMIINLNGTYYHYCSMPEPAWNSFKSASSFGTFYNQSIKGSYDCRIYPVPQYE